MLKDSPVDVKEIYNDYALYQREQNRIERYEGNEGWYHASGAGSCSRKLYFESVTQVKSTNQIERKSHRILRLGTILHDDFEKAFNLYNNQVYNSLVIILVVIQVVILVIIYIVVKKKIKIKKK